MWEDKQHRGGTVHCIRKCVTYESDSSELDSVVLDCSAFHLLYLSTSSVR